MVAWPESQGKTDRSKTFSLSLPLITTTSFFTSALTSCDNQGRTPLSCLRKQESLNSNNFYKKSCPSHSNLTSQKSLIKSSKGGWMWLTNRLKRSKFRNDLRWSKCAQIHVNMTLFPSYFYTFRSIHIFTLFIFV